MVNISSIVLKAERAERTESLMTAPQSTKAASVWSGTVCDSVVLVENLEPGKLLSVTSSFIRRSASFCFSASPVI